MAEKDFCSFFKSKGNKTCINKSALTKTPVLNPKKDTKPITKKESKKQKEEKLEKMKKYVQCMNEIIDSIVTQTELPIHYAKNSAAVSIMLNVILSKRADTLKEMINLYEQDCKLNSIISEIQNSNKIYIQSMSDYQSTIADCSNLITSEMHQLKAIACAPIQITGTSTIYTY